MAKVEGHEVTEAQIVAKMPGTHGFVAGCCGLAEHSGLYMLRTVEDALAIRAAAFRKPIKMGTLAISGQTPLGYAAGYVICTTARAPQPKIKYPGYIDYGSINVDTQEDVLKKAGFVLLAEFVNPAHPSYFVGEGEQAAGSTIHLWGAPSIDVPVEEKKEPLRDALGKFVPGLAAER